MWCAYVSFWKNSLRNFRAKESDDNILQDEHFGDSELWENEYDAQPMEIDYTDYEIYLRKDGKKF